jgi:hypothetical protein
VDDSEDYFRLSSLAVTWRAGRKPDITNWHWYALMKRASRRVAKAAHLAADDLIRLANGAVDALARP